MKIRVVILNYFGQKDIVTSLESLKEFLKVDADIVVWNNGGSTELIENFAERNQRAGFQIFVIQSPRNIGFSPGVNRAVEWSPGRTYDFIFLLNSDAQLLGPVTDVMLDELNSLGGVCGLKVYNSADKKQRQKSARTFPSLLTAVTSRQSLVAKLFPGNPWTRRYLGAALDENRVQRVDWVSGCALVCTKEAWKKLHGFDESFFFGVEDVDLGRRAQRDKIPVHFYPKIEILHIGGVSAKQRAWKSDFHHHLGMWNYYIKWTNPFGFFLSPFIFVGILGRFLVRRFYQVRSEF